MTSYNRVMRQLTPSEETLLALTAIPKKQQKAKNFLLKKTMVLAVVVLLTAALSGFTAYAATEVYGWQRLEKDIVDRGGTVTARYYETADDGERLKSVEYEYDSIYHHITGKARLVNGVIVAEEAGELKEEYQYLADGEDSVGISLNQYAGGEDTDE
ncbi:MAG: hypothetical protein IJ168_11860 [Eubacterium sp.]|nr:hypothetical protein [Eubacterium sp.]